MKDEREVFKEFIVELDSLITRDEKKDECRLLEESKKRKGDFEKSVEDEWSENKYNFMRKYGHL